MTSDTNQRRLNMDLDEQKGWTVTCQGTPRKVLRLRTDWPVPKGPLSEGEVLVKVQAAGLNPS